MYGCTREPVQPKALPTRPASAFAAHGVIIDTGRIQPVDATGVPSEFSYPGGARLKISRSPWQPPRSKDGYRHEGYSLAYHPPGSRSQGVNLSSLFPFSGIPHIFRLLELGGCDHSFYIGQASPGRLPAQWFEICSIICYWQNGAYRPERVQTDEREILGILHEIGHAYAELVRVQIIEAASIGSFGNLEPRLSVYARVLHALEHAGFMAGQTDGGRIQHFGFPYFEQYFNERTAWAYALDTQKRLGWNLGFSTPEEVSAWVRKRLGSYGAHFLVPPDLLEPEQWHYLAGQPGLAAAAHNVFHPVASNLTHLTSPAQRIHA